MANVYVPPVLPAGIRVEPDCGETMGKEPAENDGAGAGLTSGLARPVPGVWPAWFLTVGVKVVGAPDGGTMDAGLPLWITGEGKALLPLSVPPPPLKVALKEVAVLSVTTAGPTVK